MRTGVVLARVTLTALLALGSGDTTQRSTALLYDKGGDLYATTLDGSRTVRLTETRVREAAPAVSADGKRIAFIRQGPTYGNAWTMSLDGKQLRKLTRGGTDWSPVWAPDGRTIYFIRFQDTSMTSGPCGSLFAISAAGGKAHRVLQPRAGHSIMEPALSPDGHRIAFNDWNGCSGGYAGPMLRVTDTTGRPTGDLAHLRGNGYYPHPEHYSATWSPDGRRIAFGVKGRLTVAARDGSNVRRIGPRQLTIADAWTHPAWSPDGRWIAAVDQYHGALYIVHPDGSVSRRLLRTGEGDSTPAWLRSLPAGD